MKMVVLSGLLESILDIDPYQSRPSFNLDTPNNRRFAEFLPDDISPRGRFPELDGSSISEADPVAKGCARA
jgi:hypothetical protein